MLHFEKQSEEALLNFLKHLSTRDAVLNYQQIQGLLYAMVCSPEPIKPSEWFELIWLNDDPQFENPAEAKSFFQLLTGLCSSVAEEVHCNRYRPGAVAGAQCTAQGLADWCDGFLMGHHYLEDLWDVALDDIGDEHLFEQIDAALDWACACVEGDIVEWAGDDGDEILLAEYLRFEQLLQEYRAVHARWQRGDWQYTIEQTFTAMQPLGRDELCLCGSGKPFKHCCLH